jgi:hypothetical protein
VSGRPEATGGGYNDRGSDDYDRDAWQEFTPWRPGDPSTAGEAPPSYYGGNALDDQIYRPGSGDGRAAPPAEEQQGGNPGAVADQGGRRGSWWTEANPKKLQGGDKVRATGALGGDFISSVQSGTKGRIVETSSGLLGGERATVKFDNGYEVKNVPVEKLERRGWLD